jgi:hypothetical protein
MNHVNVDNELSLNLNGNSLSFDNLRGWILHSSDLDIAMLEIDKLLEEKEVLVESLSESVAQIEEFRKQSIELDHMKNVVLEMVGLLVFLILFEKKNVISYLVTLNIE